MVSLSARILLFIGSYAPLSFIIFILYVGRNNWVAYIALLMCGFGLAGTCRILYVSQKDVASYSRTIEDIREPGDGIMGYVASYLVPFVGFPLGPIREDVAFIILLLVLAFLYVTTDMLHINPLLRVFQYHVYEITFVNGSKTGSSSSKQVQYLIAKGELSRHSIVTTAKFARGIWIEGVAQ